MDVQLLGSRPFPVGSKPVLAMAMDPAAKKVHLAWFCDIKVVESVTVLEERAARYALRSGTGGVEKIPRVV